MAHLFVHRKISDLEKWKSKSEARDSVRQTVGPAPRTPLGAAGETGRVVCFFKVDRTRKRPVYRIPGYGTGIGRVQPDCYPGGDAA